MRRKHAPVREDGPIPAMLAGDVAPPVSGPAALAPLQKLEEPPGDPCVVMEGTSAARLLTIAAVLLVALPLGVIGLDWMDPDLSSGVWLTCAAFLVGGWGALVWLVHHDLIRRRREFRLTDDAIEVTVWPLTAGALRVTRIPWTDIADHTVSVDAGRAFLRVLSVDGYTLTVNDRPPRPATREFIWRFVERAEREPRAVSGKPHAEGTRLPDVTGEGSRAAPGCLAFFVVVVGGGSVETVLGLSYAQEMAGLAVVGLVALMVAIWVDLDDPEIAGSDAESNRLIARLRTWLRRVLRMRPS